MKLFSILVTFLTLIIVVAALNVYASGFSILYQQGVSEVLNMLLYAAGLVGLVALKRKILK